MHANAPLTVRGRMILVGRIASGRPVAHVAAEMGISRKTADKWWKRWLVEGEPGLEDRSSRPRRCPHQTPARLERRIIVLRQRRKLGPARIASIVSLPTSTVHRVLSRHGLNRLAWMDRPSGRVIRRIQTDHPGELVHIDVKKLGRIPPGGGAGPWSGQRRPSVHHQGGVRLRPLGHRRPQPAGLLRSPLRRKRADLRRILRAGPGLLRRPRDRRRGGAHRQRQELPGPGLHRSSRRRPTPKDPASPTSDQWKSGTPQPHPARRVGLRADLHLKCPAHPSS